MIYCNSVWGHCKKNALNPLIVTHKKILRALAGVCNNYPTFQIFEDTRLLTLDNINKYMVGIFVYKCLQDLDFSLWFSQENPSYFTRFMSTNPLSVPRIRNVHTEQCILYRGAVIWNHIPLEIRNKSYETFKCNFKAFLNG